MTIINDIIDYFFTDLHVEHLRSIFTETINIITLYSIEEDKLLKLFDYIKLIIIYIGIIGLLVTTFNCPLKYIYNLLEIPYNIILLIKIISYLLLISIFRNLIIDYINDDYDTYIPSEIVNIFNIISPILEPFVGYLNNIFSFIPNLNIITNDIILLILIWIIKDIEPLNLTLNLINLVKNNLKIFIPLFIILFVVIKNLI